MPPFIDEPPIGGRAANTTAPGFDPADRPAVADWSIDHPFVARLIAELRAARDAASSNAESALAGYFLARAEDDGTLPVYAGHISKSAIAALCGRTMFDTGRTRTGRLYNRFKHAFRLETERIDMADDPALPLTRRVDRYVLRQAASGEGLPGIVGHHGVNLGRIADELGVPRYKLQCDTAAAKRLHTALRNGEIEIGRRFPRISTALTDVESAHEERLRAVVAEMDRSGRPLPESPARRGSPDFDYIAELAGTPGPTLQDHLPYNRYVKEVARRRGTLPPGVTISLDTLAAVLDHVGEAIAREQREKKLPSAESDGRNHASAVRQFAEKLGLDLSDEAESAFGASFEDNLIRAKATYANPGSARNFERLIRRAHALRLERLGASGLPDGFREALRSLMASKDVTVPVIAAATGIAKGSLHCWISGTCLPAEGSLPAIEKLERFLGVPVGTLSSRLPNARIRQIHPSLRTEHFKALDPQARVRLPAAAALWPAKQLEDAVGRIAHLLPGSSEFGRILQRAAEDGYRYAAFEPDPRFRADFDRYVQHKMSTTTELERGRNSTWGEATAAMRQPVILQFFRFACGPVTDGPGSGLGLPASEASMSWLSAPKLVLAFIGARSNRFADIESESGRRGRVWSRTELQFVRATKSLVHPAHGWLTQQPAFADELLPMPVRLSDQQRVLLDRQFGRNAVPLTAAETESARTDWAGWCRQAHRSFEQAEEYLKHRVRTVRNPFLPIDGLIRSGTPMAELLALIVSHSDQWADRTTSRTFWMNDVRNTVMMWLHAITSFRPSNLYELTYTGDDEGKIRKRNGVWTIEVPFEEFKNHKSSEAFGPETNRQNYRRDLVDEGGLYDLLDLYFFEVRPEFRNSGSLTAAFISRDGTAISEDSYRNALKRFSRLNLEWNPVTMTGIPGVTGFYPYCFRHVQASEILSTSTSGDPYAIAARALQTSVEMIRKHYGWLLPERVHAEAADSFSASMAKAQELLQQRRSGLA